MRSRSLAPFVVALVFNAVGGSAVLAQNEEWVARYDGPDHGNDEPVAIAVDKSGFVYVAATTEMDGHAHYATLKYDPDGGLQWAARWGSPAGGDSFASALALASDVDWIVG